MPEISSTGIYRNDLFEGGLSCDSEGGDSLFAAQSRLQDTEFRDEQGVISAVHRMNEDFGRRGE